MRRRVTVMKPTGKWEAGEIEAIRVYPTLGFLIGFWLKDFFHGLSMKAETFQRQPGTAIRQTCCRVHLQ